MAVAAPPAVGVLTAAAAAEAAGPAPAVESRPEAGAALTAVAEQSVAEVAVAADNSSHPDRREVAAVVAVTVTARADAEDQRHHWEWLAAAGPVAAHAVEAVAFAVVVAPPGRQLPWPECCS